VDRNRWAQRRGHGKCCGYGGPFRRWRGVDYFRVEDAHFCCVRGCFFRFLKGVCVPPEVVMERGREDRGFREQGVCGSVLIGWLAWGWKKPVPQVGPTLQIIDHSQRNYHTTGYHPPRKGSYPPSSSTDKDLRYYDTPRLHHFNNVINRGIIDTRPEIGVAWIGHASRCAVEFQRQ